MKANQTIVAFHIGRGGHFHNPGHLSYLDEKPISHYVDDLFLNYENEKDFKNRYGYDSTGDSDQRCILDLITDKDFDELEERFGITEEQLGEAIYFDGGGNPVGLTESECEIGIGRINIDYDYDTTYTRFLSDCNEAEMQAILDYQGYVKSEIINYCKETLGIEKEKDEENETPAN